MNKLLAKLSFVMLCSLGIVSCKTNYYQVYSVNTDGAKQVDNSLVFKNEDCRVYYNLWSNNGKINFAFSNKTDKDIFINFGQTFFIKNSFAIDYYQGRIYSEQSYVQTTSAYGTSKTTLNGNGLWGNNIYKEDISVISNAGLLKLIKSNSTAVTTKEKEIVCIPAKCFKIFSYYSADPSKVVTCDDKKDFPKSKAFIHDYDKQTSPLIFTNRIAYGFNKNEVAEKHIENTFWISSITNYSQKAATEKVYEEQLCAKKNKKSKAYDSHTTNQYKIRQFKIGGPNKFYKFYQKKGL